MRSLDPKGRLMLSPEYRESLALRMINTQNNTILNQNLTQTTPLFTTQSPPFSPTTQTSPLSQEEQEENALHSIIQQQNPDLALQKNQTPPHTTTQNLGEQISPPKETKFVITTYDNCLAGFSWPDWLVLEDQFSRLVNPSSKLRAFRRLFIGGAEEHTFDSQGRIRISADHKEYAKLEKEVTVIGLITRFELWNPQLLKSHTTAQSLDDVTQELGASGIDFAL